MNSKKENVKSSWTEFLKTINPVNTENDAWYFRLRDWFLCWILRVLLGADKYYAMVSKAFIEYSVSDLLNNSNMIYATENLLREELVFKKFITELRERKGQKRINDASLIKEFEDEEFQKFMGTYQDFQEFLCAFGAQPSVENQKKLLIEWLTSDKQGDVHLQVKKNLVNPFLYFLFAQEGMTYNPYDEPAQQETDCVQSENPKPFDDLLQGGKIMLDLTEDYIKEKTEDTKPVNKMDERFTYAQLQKKCSVESVDSYVNMFFILYFSYIYNVQTVNRLIDIKKNHARILHN